MPRSDEKSKILVIIPARGGSKGIPRKNIKELCGKPLIAYSIEVALKTKLIDRVVVSTEDEEIASIAKAFGAEVPVLRPLDLAQDRSNIYDAVTHTLHALQVSGYCPDIIVTLFPTHPFRTPGLLDFLVKKVCAGYSPVLTVKAISRPSKSYLLINQTGDILPLSTTDGDHQNESRRFFFRQHGLFIGSCIYFDGRPYLHTIRNPFSLIDIDTIEDFCLAKEVISCGLFNFNSNEYPDRHYPDVS